MKFDVLLVSGARPELLKTTLSSFEQNLFRNIEIGTCYLNIDPFEGGPEEVKLCEEVCNGFFDKVVSRKPATPNFTAAVKWLWSSPTSDWCLHLEDDWILNRQIGETEISKGMKSRVTQMPLMTAEKHWEMEYPYHYMVKRRKFLGFRIHRLDKSRPLFTTSPSFIQSAFAKQCSELMRLDLDPEKQLYRANVPLNNFTKNWRSRFIGSRDDIVAVDIGRAHRAEKGIKKIIKDGNSIWTREDGQA